jgi:hypothetical protein
MDFETFNKTPVLLPFVMKHFRQQLQQTVRRHGEHLIGVIFKSNCCPENYIDHVLFLYFLHFLVNLRNIEPRSVRSSCWTLYVENKDERRD